MIRRARRVDRGSVYVMMTCLIMLTWSALAMILLRLASETRTAARTQMSAAALGLAEGGAAKALWESSQKPGYRGDDEIPLGDGSFSVSVKREGGELIVTATGWIPNKANVRFSQSVRVVATPGGGVLSWQKL